MVLKGRPERDVAEREIRVMAAIAWYFTTRAADREAQRPPGTWAERVHTLRREIALRRTLYPRWIDTGRIAPEEAARRLGLIESMQDFMWHDRSAEADAGRAEHARRTSTRLAA